MDLDAAYLFRGGQGAESDGASSQRHTSNQAPARTNALRDQVPESKMSLKAVTSISDHGPGGAGPGSASSSERYVAGYSATNRQSLRLSTASYSTAGESEITSFGEPALRRDSRKLYRGVASEEHPSAPNAYGVRPSESVMCASGPPSQTQTPLVTPPSSLAHTDRGQDDTVQMAELQQKLEVSCEWAYELENDVAELSLEVEGLRELCAQLQHTLDRRDQDLKDAQLSNLKMRKRLASTEGLLAEKFGVLGAVLPPPSSNRSMEDLSRLPASYPPPPMQPASVTGPHYTLSPPLSCASTSRAPHAASAYPQLTPLRTSLSCISMRSMAGAPEGPGDVPCNECAPRSGSSYSAPRPMARQQ
eukprot:jgi/Ulvmu1/9057/UM005_0150.1